MTQERSAALVPVPTGDDLIALTKLGKLLAASGFFKDAQKEAQAVVKVLAGQEIGIPPIAAMTGIHIITTKTSTNVSIGANIMAGLVKKSPRYDYKVDTLTTERCVLKFFENGQSVGESSYTLEEAKHAGLVRAGGNWDKYPKNMLFARAVSNGTRLYCPDLLGGAPVCTPDELGIKVDEHGDAVIEGEVVSIDGELPSHQEAPKRRQAPARQQPTTTPPKSALAPPSGPQADGEREDEEPGPSSLGEVVYRATRRWPREFPDAVSVWASLGYDAGADIDITPQAAWVALLGAQAQEG